MALNISLVRTSRASTSEPVEVPANVAKDLQDTYEALKGESQMVNASVEFGSPEDARLFARQAKAWAAENGKKFSRKGSVRDNPKTVQFRVYDPTGRAGGPGHRAAK